MKMNPKSPHLITNMELEIYKHDQVFELESGKSLPEFQLAYSTTGQLNPSKDNVIWVIHALTGDTNVQIWWSGLVGDKKFFDPNKHFIICANLLGSCYGSTHPLSENPETGEPFYYDFPNLTTRDMAKSLDLLRESLGLSRINTIIGGSLGGQVALEWAYILGDRVDNAVILASNSKTSPWTIGFNETQRMAIESDITWGQSNPNAGKKGLEAARAIAMLSYRHPENFAKDQAEDTEKTDTYKISSYLRYQGKKLSNRFNAFSYWLLSKAMDSHDIGRGRGGVENALSKISSKVLAIGVDRDLLFLKEESQLIARQVQHGTYREIQSSYGHDAFLIEYAQLNEILDAFYKEQ